MLPTFHASRVVTQAARPRQHQGRLARAKCAVLMVTQAARPRQHQGRLARAKCALIKTYCALPSVMGALQVPRVAEARPAISKSLTTLKQIVRGTSSCSRLGGATGWLCGVQRHRGFRAFTQNTKLLEIRGRQRVAVRCLPACYINWE